MTQKCAPIFPRKYATGSYDADADADNFIDFLFAFLCVFL